MDKITKLLEKTMISVNLKHWFGRGTNKPRSFSVHGVGYRETMAPCLINRPQGTGDILLMLFHDPVQVRTDGEVGTCTPETLVIWDCGMGHYYGSETGQWCHSWLHCGGGLAEQLIKESGLARDRLIANCGDIFTSGLEELYEERIQPAPDSAILNNLFENMLRRMARATASSRPAHIPERLLRAKRLLETGYATPVGLHELATKARLSPSHFSAEYRRHFGISPIQDQTRLRMLEAEHLLLDINLSIAEIAERIGYPDIFHFSKQFKRHHGHSPSQFRKSKRLKTAMDEK
jgi:AraC family transcriptional regulator of arabinose operon